MDVRNIEEVPAFITKDGSEIRELLAHRNSCIERQSLAEARVPAGGCTTAHVNIRRRRGTAVLARPQVQGNIAIASLTSTGSAKVYRHTITR